VNTESTLNEQILRKNKL